MAMEGLKKIQHQSENLLGVSLLLEAAFACVGFAGFAYSDTS